MIVENYSKKTMILSLYNFSIHTHIIYINFCYRSIEFRMILEIITEMQAQKLQDK